jgi:kynurenine aminotransferase
MPEFWNRTITIGSAGKTFGVTGWRVGWLIGPQELLAPALAAHTRIVFCVNSPLQVSHRALTMPIPLIIGDVKRKLSP